MILHVSAGVRFALLGAMVALRCALAYRDTFDAGGVLSVLKEAEEDGAGEELLATPGKKQWTSEKRAQILLCRKGVEVFYEEQDIYFDHTYDSLTRAVSVLNGDNGDTPADQNMIRFKAEAEQRGYVAVCSTKGGEVWYMLLREDMIHSQSEARKKVDRVERTITKRQRMKGMKKGYTVRANSEIEWIYNNVVIAEGELGEVEKVEADDYQIMFGQKGKVAVSKRDLKKLEVLETLRDAVDPSDEVGELNVHCALGFKPRDRVKIYGTDDPDGETALIENVDASLDPQKPGIITLTTRLKKRHGAGAFVEVVKKAVKEVRDRDGDSHSVAGGLSGGSGSSTEGQWSESQYVAFDPASGHYQDVVFINQVGMGQATVAQVVAELNSDSEPRLIGSGAWSQARSSGICRIRELQGQWKALFAKGKEGEARRLFAGADANEEYESYEALYDFAPTADDELRVTAGDIVQFVSWEGQDEAWFKGRKGNSEGAVPTNYFKKVGGATPHLHPQYSREDSSHSTYTRDDSPSSSQESRTPSRQSSREDTEVVTTLQVAVDEASQKDFINLEDGLSFDVGDQVEIKSTENGIHGAKRETVEITAKSNGVRFDVTPELKYTYPAGSTVTKEEPVTGLTAGSLVKVRLTSDKSYKWIFAEVVTVGNGDDARAVVPKHYVKVRFLDPGQSGDRIGKTVKALKRNIRHVETDQLAEAQALKEEVDRKAAEEEGQQKVELAQNEEVAAVCEDNLCYKWQGLWLKAKVTNTTDTSTTVSPGMVEIRFVDPAIAGSNRREKRLASTLKRTKIKVKAIKAKVMTWQEYTQKEEATRRDVGGRIRKTKGPYSKLVERASKTKTIFLDSVEGFLAEDRLVVYNGLGNAEVVIVNTTNAGQGTVTLKSKLKGVFDMGATVVGISKAPTTRLYTRARKGSGDVHIGHPLPEGFMTTGLVLIYRGGVGEVCRLREVSMTASPIHRVLTLTTSLIKDHKQGDFVITLSQATPIRRVVFDNDNTLSVFHVLKGLAGDYVKKQNSRRTPEGVFVVDVSNNFTTRDPTKKLARTEVGQVELIKEIDQELYQLLPEEEKPGAPREGLFAYKAYGGKERVEELRQFLQELQDRGVELFVVTKGLVGPTNYCLEQLGLLEFFKGGENVHGHIKGPYATRSPTDWDTKFDWDHPDDHQEARLMGKENQALKSSKKNLILKWMFQEDYSKDQVVFVDDDEKDEIAPMKEVCITLGVQHRMGIRTSEMNTLRGYCDVEPRVEPRVWAVPEMPEGWEVVQYLAGNKLFEGPAPTYASSRPWARDRPPVTPLKGFKMTISTEEGESNNRVGYLKGQEWKWLPPQDGPPPMRKNWQRIENTDPETKNQYPWKFIDGSPAANKKWQQWAYENPPVDMPMGWAMSGWKKSGQQNNRNWMRVWYHPTGQGSPVPDDPRWEPPTQDDAM